MNKTIANLPRCVRASRWMLPLLLLPVLAAPSACAQAGPDVEPSEKKPSAPATPRLVEMGASWAEYYNTMADLKAHGDIAVLGTVSSISPAAVPAQGGPVYQMVTLAAERTLWTRSQTTAKPASVTFEQTGGTFQGVTYQIEDDPLFHVGDRAVLFFTEYSPGKYRVTGGPTGRFAIVGGHVKPTVADGVQVPPGTGESAFIATL
jgi:hypothetical protein